MGDEKDWQKQLMTAALAAATKAAMQYITNPEARDGAMDDVKAKLAEVDYGSAAKAVSEVIDRMADGAKSAVADAIDSLRENAEVAVEAAAEKAQEKVGVPARKRGRGRMFLGILLGIALGFILLNEERRNMLMDKVSGASGPSDAGLWSTVTPKPAVPASDHAGDNGTVTDAPTPPPIEEAATAAVPKEAEAVANTDTSAESAGSVGSKTKKAKASEEAKSDA
jgi:hypothetical protein